MHLVLKVHRLIHRLSIYQRPIAPTIFSPVLEHNEYQRKEVTYCYRHQPDLHRMRHQEPLRPSYCLRA